MAVFGGGGQLGVELKTEFVRRGYQVPAAKVDIKEVEKVIGNFQVVDPKALRALLAQVNEQGYALDLGEYESEVRCVAAPIRNHSGAVVAAMSVSGPAQRIEPMLTEGLVPEVVRVARAISRLLGNPASDTARGVVKTRTV